MACEEEGGLFGGFIFMFVFLLRVFLGFGLGFGFVFWFGSGFFEITDTDGRKS